MFQEWVVKVHNKNSGGIDQQRGTGHVENVASLKNPYIYKIKKKYLISF